MNFERFIKRVFAVICLMGFILIFSCEIGLGAAVDVADPTSGISYPPKNAVVRDTFIAAGDCSDDMKVTSVKVSLIQPETNKTYGPYEAEVNEDGSGWKVSLNKNDPEKVTNAFDSYKQWEFPDGNYIISAVAYDSEGKSSPAATSPISIDNTPPVLIVSKPLAIGSEPATIYGSTLKLSGDIAEDHETSKLVVYYKQYDASTGAVIEGGNSGTIEITDSAELNAMSSSNPLIIAQFDKSGNPNEQHEKYVSLYGSTADDVDRYFYSGFMLEDSARVYQAPGDTGAGDGNQTVQYYLLGDEFQNNLAVNYSLTAQRLMNVLKGNSDDYTDSQIGSISSSLLTPGNYASSTWVSNNEASKFSLNPHNNPTWSLGNYGVSAGATQFEPYTAGSSLVLTLNAGRDASYPDPRTVRVDLYDLGENDSSLVGKNPVCLIGPGGIFAESWDESADDSTKSYTFVLDTESFNGIEKNHLYQMVVSGTDRNKTDLEPEGQKRFIFRLSTSNNIPKVTITGPAEDITFKGDDVNDNGVIIRGYVNTDGVPLKPSDELNISRLDISDVNNSVPVTLSIANFNTTILSLAEDNEVPHKYNFELKLAKNGTGTGFVESTPSKYLYIATVQAKDRTGLAGEKKIKFYVDNKAPDLTINAPTPTVSETEGATTNTYVNGKITISGNASDSGVAGSGLKSLRYVIRNNLNDTVPVKSGNIPLSESWSFDVETKDLTSSEASYYVIVEAEDTVGNKNVDLDSSTPIVHTDENPNPAVKQITVKQSTDTPKLNLTNANPSVNSEAGLTQTTNMFGTTSNNKLYGSITDDDGLASVTASWQKIGSSESGSLAAASALVAGSKSYNFEYTLPSVEGKYTITIHAEDNKHETDAYTLSKSFVITVDNGAPTFSAVTPQTTSSSYYMGSKAGAQKTLTVSGTVSDGNGLNASEGFTVKHYKKNGSVWPEDEDTSDTKPVSSLAATPAVSPATTGTFTDNIQLPSADGVYKVAYTAKDVYNQTFVYPVEYSVDVTAPAFAVYDPANPDSTPPAMVGTSRVTGSDRIGWIHDNNVNVAAFVYDPEVSGVKSGIGSVSYSLADAPGENDWTDMTHSVSEDSAGLEKWIASVQFIDGAEKVLNLLVKDSVGNEVTQNINVKVDRTKPVLDVKWYQLSDGTPSGTSSFFTPSGTAYVNSTNNKDLVIYANYTDISDASGTDNSGVTVPTFKIGTTDITPTITYYKEAFTDTVNVESVMSSSNVIDYSAENAKQQIKSFKAVISHEVFATDDVIVSGHDEAGNRIENDNRAILRLENDEVAPTVSVPNISNTYKPASGTIYYYRNAEGQKLTIKGTTTDNGPVDKTVLTITGQNGASYTVVSTSTSWTFENIDLTGWATKANGADATIAITAYDKAGNSKSITPVSLEFDSDAPKILTGGDNGSDPLDISNPYVSDYTLRDKPALKYGGISIGRGKYGDTSYGRESSIQIGVTYIGENNGSGVSKMEYKMLSSSHAGTYKTLTTGPYGETLPNVSWTKEGEFAVSLSTYKHRNDPESAAGYPCFVGRATISGFENTTDGVPNLLFVRATDNCGNVSEWFTLLIQMDNENPEINSDSSNPIALLTNGKSTLPTIKGNLKEGYYSSGLKAARVYINGVLAIDGNFTKTPAAGLTVVAKDAEGNILTGNAYQDAVEVSFTNNYGTLKYTGYAPTEAQLSSSTFIPDENTTKCSFMNAASYATWELTLTPQEGSWFDGIKNLSSPQIYLEAEDWAEDSTGSGNKSNVFISAFDIDIKKPTVSLTSPVCDEGESLNGKHTIKGSVTENHTIETVAIYYSTVTPPPANLNDSGWGHLKTLTTKEAPLDIDENSTDPEDLLLRKIYVTNTGTNINTIYGKTLQSLYSFELSEKFDFNDHIGTASNGTVYLLTYAIDKAGNPNVASNLVTETKSETDPSYVAIKRYDVNRNSDRPVVTITKAILATESAGVESTIARNNPKQIDTRTINVSVSDDDGVSEVQYRVTKIVKNPDNPDDTANDITGTWTPLTLSSGSGVIKINEDGDHAIEFRVKDTDNTYWFESNPEDYDPFKRIYLTDIASTPHKYGTDSSGYTNPTAYFKIDTEVPSIKVKKIKLLSTEADDSSVEWITNSFSNHVVGGPSTSYLRVMVEASDVGTGIKDVKISAKLNGADVPTIAASETTETTSGSLYEVVIPCTVSGTTIENVNFVATIMAEDNAGKQSSESLTFKADNKGPTITINSPASTDRLSGSVTADGQFSESARVFYSISPIVASPDTYTSSTEFSYVKYDNETPVSPAVTLPATDKAGHTITLAEGLETICAYQPMNVGNPDARMMSFYLWFDGKFDASGSHSHTLNNWIKKLGITTTADLTSPTNSFDDLIRLYLHVKAIDDAGNINEEHWPILLDPQGSRPHVTIGYPSAEKAGNNTEGITLGGAPTIIGTATGTNIVDYVWLQVDCNASNTWTIEDFDTLKNTGVYKLGRMSTKQLVTAFEEGTDINDYGIRVELSGLNWSQQINKNKELDPEEDSSESTKNIKIWAYATDKAGFISSQEIRKIILDSQSPVIDQSVNLVQWSSGFDGSNGFNIGSDGNITFATGATSALRAYNENENIQGKWFLIGKVSDESGIKTVSYKVNGGTLVRAIINSDESYVGTGDNEGVYIRRYIGNNYIFCLPIGNDDDGVFGEYSIAFTAEEIEDSNPRSAERTFRVRYDNKAPEVDAKLVGITVESDVDVEMMNSNGVYTFSGIAYENKENGVSQTGVDRIAFYFTRNISGQATKIFDPMIRSGKTGNSQNYSSLTSEFGLYWQAAIVNVDHGTITVPAGTSLVNVHKGGLVKVNGVIYTITGTNETSHTVSFEGDAGVTNGVQALFAIANVVDNATREGEGDSDHKITTDYGYGYYSNGSFDDGDLMVESLVQEGTKYTWEVSINSKNISDGPVTLHYVVFDKAGNVSELKEQNFFIKNNAPRLAGIELGTDDNGNGSVDEDEFISSYSGIYEKGYNGNNKISTLTVPTASTNTAPQSVFKIKGKTVINPEIVGGNGSVSYTYSVAKRNTAGTDWSAPYKSVTTATALGTGTAADDDHSITLNAAGGIVFDVIDFLRNEITDGENQKFTFTIKDSTPGHTGIESQTATLNVIMDVALNDETPAKNKIIPFYWNGKDKNSLKGNSSSNGHIELTKDLAGLTGINNTNPKISGAIKLEGIAQDNNILSGLTVRIGTTDCGIATYSDGTWTERAGTGWRGYITQATYEEFKNAGYITTIPSGKSGTDKVPYTSQDYGHVVHWTMEIDTEAMAIPVQTDLVISVSATDKGKPTLSGTGESATVSYTPTDFANNGDGDTPAQTGGTAGTSAYTCKYTVDVVPYITGVKTMLSTKSSNTDTSEFDRTALGHYPLATTETVVMTGFNLAGGTVKFNSAEGTNATVAYNAGGFAIPAAAKSGEVSVIVNGVESLNNKNNNNAQGVYSTTVPAPADYGKRTTYTKFTNFYNRKPNTKNNYVLTDDVVFDIWKFNSEAAKPNGGGRIDEAVMKVNPATKLIGFAFLDSYNTFALPGNNNSYRVTEAKIDDQEDFRSTSSLTYDWQGWAYATDAGGGEGQRIRFWIIKDDGTDIGVNFEVISQYGTRAQPFGNKKTSATDTTNNERIDMRYKVRSPSIATSKGDAANSTNMYFAYYDSFNDEIRFKSGNTSAKGLFTTRRRNEYTCSNSQVIATDASKNLPEGAAYQYTGTPLGKAGEFVCIDVIPKGTLGTTQTKDIVVLVWYDATAAELKYTYNADPLNYQAWQSTNAATNKAGTKDINQDYRGLNSYGWAPAKTIFTGETCGEYCQIKVDQKGGIHIAAYDAVYADLNYAFLESYDTAEDDIEKYTVDSCDNAGSHLTMDVAYDKAVADGGKAVPYISYWGSGMPKIAYKKASSGDGAVDDMFTGNWEVSYIPTTSTISDLDEKRLRKLDNRINVALWKYADDGSLTTIQNSVPGTSSATAATGTCWGNGTNNPVVGYSIAKDSTDDRIETAQMQ